MSVDEALNHLLAICPEVVAAAVVGGDGALLSLHPGDTEGDAVGPLATTLGGVAERVAQELGRGALEQAVLSGTNGTVVLSDLGRGRVLATVVDRGARLGLLLDDVNVCATSLRTALDREAARA